MRSRTESTTTLRVRPSRPRRTLADIPSPGIRRTTANNSTSACWIRAESDRLVSTRAPTVSCSTTRAKTATERTKCRTGESFYLNLLDASISFHFTNRLVSWFDPGRKQQGLQSGNGRGPGRVSSSTEGTASESVDQQLMQQSASRTRRKTIEIGSFQKTVTTLHDLLYVSLRFLYLFRPDRLLSLSLSCFAGHVPATHLSRILSLFEASSFCSVPHSDSLLIPARVCSSLSLSFCTINDFCFQTCFTFFILFHKK